MREGYLRGALSPHATQPPAGRARRLRGCWRIRPGRRRARGHPAQHREASPRRPAGAIGPNNPAADLRGASIFSARRPEPRARVTKPLPWVSAAASVRSWRRSVSRAPVYGVVISGAGASSIASPTSRDFVCQRRLTVVGWTPFEPPLIILRGRAIALRQPRSQDPHELRCRGRPHFRRRIRKVVLHGRVRRAEAAGCRLLDPATRTTSRSVARSAGRDDRRVLRCGAGRRARTARRSAS